MSTNLIGCTHLMGVHAFFPHDGNMLPRIGRRRHAPNVVQPALLNVDAPALAIRCPQCRSTAFRHADTPSPTLMLPRRPTSTNQCPRHAPLPPHAWPTAEPSHCIPHCRTAQSRCLAPPPLIRPLHGAPNFLVIFLYLY